MAKLSNYLEKKRLMDKLADELRQLEEDTGLKRELQFEADIKALLKEYDFTAKHAFNVLAAVDPSLAPNTASKSDGPKRAMKTYKNPHTGEIVKTRGGNQKTLNEWRKEYGAETVASWEQTN
eukprot:TRINITY_DN5888_c0_g1_i1.p4 TRINITY_DN5888_c0_g1~~TRINITY_DN5888_c0_g1_i1.p4  ORF type:complete len:143 (-),score=10.12 TRINITY_DN5888_c0_g1_i1:5379-5744(-)